MRHLFPRALYKTSSQDPHMRHHYTRSLDIPGPPKSLHRSSLQDLFTRPLWEIPLQEPSTRFSQDLYERSLYKSSLQDLFTGPHMRHLFTSSPDIPGPPRSLHRSSLQELFTRPLWEISFQELSTGSLHKTSMRDLFTRALYKISSQGPHMRHLYTSSPDIPEPPRSLHRSSLQDLFTRPLWEFSIQDISTRSLHKTSMRDL